MKETGFVKWFNDDKGYGFIVPDKGGTELFVHYSAIQMKGHKQLSEGQRVRFLREQTPKGLAASEVELI